MATSRHEFEMHARSQSGVPLGDHRKFLSVPIVSIKPAKSTVGSSTCLGNREQKTEKERKGGGGRICHAARQRAGGCGARMCAAASGDSSALAAQRPVSHAESPCDIPSAAASRAVNAVPSLLAFSPLPSSPVPPLN